MVGLILLFNIAALGKRGLGIVLALVVVLRVLILDLHFGLALALYEGEDYEEAGLRESLAYQEVKYSEDVEHPLA